MDRDLLKLAYATSSEIIKTEPLEAYKDMRRPFLFDLNDEFHDYTIRSADLDIEKIHELGDLLDNAFDATAAIVTNALRYTNRTINKNMALRIAKHDRTVETIGTVAHQSPKIARQLIEQARTPSTPFAVNCKDEFISFLYPNYQDLDPIRRCPAVSSKDSELIVSPAFQKFVIWSGTLAVYSMYKRRRIN